MVTTSPSQCLSSDSNNPHTLQTVSWGADISSDQTLHTDEIEAYRSTIV